MKSRESFATGKEQLNKWTITEYIRNLIMIGLKIPFWIVQYSFYYFPVKKNRMLIYSYKQKGYGCNLKYLTEYIVENCGDEFEVIWVVKNKAGFEQLGKKGVQVVELLSATHILLRFRAHIVITNDEFHAAFIKRFKQIYVNTWHGGINYKQIGYSGIDFVNILQKWIYKSNNPKPDIFVSGSGSFTDSTSKAFKIPQDVFCESGLPRNDFLFRCGSDKQITIRNKIGVDVEQKILIYAPTFRKGKASAPNHLNYNKIIATLNKRFGGQWTVLIRNHYFVADSKQTETLGDNVVDVSGYDDIQELMAVSECMISDYSSCMWDFTFTGRPCFVYAEDMEQYLREDRSFSVHVSEWPYPVCENEIELCRAISTFDNDDYQKKVKVHHQDMRAYESGVSSEKLLNQIKKKIET